MDGGRARRRLERTCQTIRHNILGAIVQDPPSWVRTLEVMLLMRSFARAFDVEAPTLWHLGPDGALDVYRSFTAACMEMAQEDERLARHLRLQLAEEALGLGAIVRRITNTPPEETFDLARGLYRGIGIRLTGSLPGDLAFGPCAFARRYTPQDCWFMSAFDEGFLRGVSGDERAELVFACRLTEGAPCCKARFAASQDKTLAPKNAGRQEGVSEAQRATGRDR